MTTRRGFLAGILAAGFAPAVVGSGVLMPVRKIEVVQDITMPLRDYIAFVHPDIEQDLRALYTGEIGRIEGVRIIGQARLPDGTRRAMFAIGGAGVGVDLSRPALFDVLKGMQ